MFVVGPAIIWRKYIASLHFYDSARHCYTAASYGATIVSVLISGQIASELLQSRTPGVDGDLALACFLASRGGDLHRKNKAGRTPLDMAGGIKCVELLLIWKTQKRYLRV